ncbi:hypothetical protein PPL_01175 [Heterostelium album PN500]|uniref:Uncharacterized protein n=1 Tax=Heterostelium pallidum (strain ATCC 26659 / Pp 5 / PN500) TaxID=670386 RepID=D3AYB5_HETP5|nr:hypothetical protein PPL_01175 [Heterostelium album PN500]EFA85942.1 hypothetical protein PPL_01175 [Heterostelium album PN500]|eukprot:XP_020438048.1 hypothetical protein PPL_01175 [Heterostelium album PN500]
MKIYIIFCITMCKLVDLTFVNLFANSPRSRSLEAVQYLAKLYEQSDQGYPSESEKSLEFLYQYIETKLQENLKKRKDRKT